jgi:hypothetical protein
MIAPRRRSKYFDRWEEHLEREYGGARPEAAAVTGSDAQSEPPARAVEPPAQAPEALRAPEAPEAPVSLTATPVSCAGSEPKPQRGGATVRARIQRKPAPIPSSKKPSGPARVRFTPPNVRAALAVLRRAPYTDADPHFVEAAAILQRVTGGKGR